MTEAEVARESEQDVEADGEDAEDHEPLHQVRVARIELREAGIYRKRVQQDRRQHGQRHDDEQDEPVMARQPQRTAAGACGETSAWFGCGADADVAGALGHDPIPP